MVVGHPSGLGITKIICTTHSIYEILSLTFTGKDVYLFGACKPGGWVKGHGRVSQDDEEDFLLHIRHTRIYIHMRNIATRVHTHTF